MGIQKIPNNMMQSGEYANTICGSGTQSDPFHSVYSLKMYKQMNPGVQNGQYWIKIPDWRVQNSQWDLLNTTPLMKDTVCDILFYDTETGFNTEDVYIKLNANTMYYQANSTNSSYGVVFNANTNVTNGGKTWDTATGNICSSVTLAPGNATGCGSGNKQAAFNAMSLITFNKARVKLKRTTTLIQCFSARFVRDASDAMFFATSSNTSNLNWGMEYGANSAVDVAHTIAYGKTTANTSYYNFGNLSTCEWGSGIWAPWGSADTYNQATKAAGWNDWVFYYDTDLYARTGYSTTSGTGQNMGLGLGGNFKAIGFGQTCSNTNDNGLCYFEIWIAP